MSENETDFEEDSFEDEFEPEEEQALERRTPKPPGMPVRTSAQARQLSALLQRKLDLHNDRRDSSGGAEAGAADTSRVSFADASNTPRPLKKLTAQFLLLATGKASLSKIIVPGHLYPILLSEAARLRNEEGIINLVSTWPMEILNLNDIDIPLDSYLQREPSPNGPCIADFIIKGLFYRKRKYCQMKMFILPKDSKIGVEILGHFARIPYYYCSQLPNLRIPKLFSAGKLKDAQKYIAEIPKLELKRPINFYSYMKDHLKLVIAIPNCVIHWLGRKANSNDVQGGLILQKNAPFIFHFDNIAMVNFVDTKAISTVLDLIINPERVRKLLLKNKRVFRPDHITYIVSRLSVSLKRLKGLRGFFTKLSALVGYGPEDYKMQDADREAIAEVMAAWPNLVRFNLHDQPLDVPDSFGALFRPVVGHLTKLSLSRAQITGVDVRIIAESRQVETIQILRLDNNDLKLAGDELCLLLPRLKAIKTLRMQACRLKYRECLRCAEALAGSQTLRIWNMTDNVVYKVRHIKEFIELCSNIVSLRAIGCKPLEFHVLLGKVVVPNKLALSASKKHDIDEFAASFNLIAF